MSDSTMDVDAFRQSKIHRTSIEATVKTDNTGMTYFNMENKKGVIVPIASHNVRDAEARGYRHTDRVAHTDDPKKHYRYGKVPESMNPLDRLTNTLEKFIGKNVAPNAEVTQAAQEVQTEINEPNAVVPSTTIDESGLELDEAENTEKDLDNNEDTV